MVTMWYPLVSLRRSMIAARVVDFPDPVGPVTITRPLRIEASLRSWVGRPNCSMVMMLVGMIRNTAPAPRRCLKRLTRKRPILIYLIREIGIAGVDKILPPHRRGDGLQQIGEIGFFDGAIADLLHVPADPQHRRAADREVEVGRPAVVHELEESGRSAAARPSRGVLCFLSRGSSGSKSSWFEAWR